jgi:putative heme iron utilization protein
MVDDQADLEEARALLRAAGQATLATIFSTTGTRDRGGWPFASLVLIAHDRDGSPLLLLSDLAEHSRNIEADDRVSLLIDGTAGLADPLTGPRLTVLGRARRSAGASHRKGFLEAHPEAALYADFSDFSIYHVAVDSAHLVAGFGRIQWISAAALLD